MNDRQIRVLRMKRQYLCSPVTEKGEYTALFQKMQPVKPIAFSCPGEPPSLVYRCAMGDNHFTEKMRSSREIVKGRFQGGAVGYVLLEDLPVFAALYKRPYRIADPKMEAVYGLLKREAPLTIGQIREETGLLAKEITPVLHKLQKSFVAYEDQIDSDWERGWYLLNDEFPNLNLEGCTRQQALQQVILWYLECNVFGCAEGIRSFLELPIKEIQKVLQGLSEEGIVTEISFAGKNGFCRTEDLAVLAQQKWDISPSVFVLHLSDYLVKCNEYWLKEQYKELPVLQYLFIDGEFHGVVTGKWKQGPHELMEVVVDLPQEESHCRKGEIFAAIREVYPHLSEKCPFRTAGILHSKSNS